MTTPRSEQIELQDDALGVPEAAVAEIEPVAAIDCSESGTIKSGRLKGLTMWQAIFVLAWPVLIESFLAALVGLVDTTLAAGLSEAATDAIGVASYFNWFINLLGVSLGIGATALVSRSIGRNRLAVANAALGQCLLLVSVAGVIGAIGIAIFAPAIASFLQLSDEAAPIAVNYMRILAIGVPCSTIIAGSIACLRGAGDSISPLVLMAIVNLVNVILSFVLSGVDFAMSRVGKDGEVINNTILANPFGFDMGTEGIAIATTVAWLVGCAVAIGMVIRGRHGLRLIGRRLRPHWHTMRRLIRVATPNFFDSFGMWVGNFITILFVGWMVTPGLYGAHIVSVRIEAFSFMPGFAISLAAATLAGQYLGAERPDLARRAILRCTSVAVAIMFAFSIGFVFIPEKIVGLFSNQQTHLEITPDLLRVCGFIQIPFAIAIVIRGAMRGAGDTKTVMFITWFSTYALRLPMAWLFSGVDIPLGNGQVIPNQAPLQEHFGIHPLVGLWIGLCAEIVLRFVIFLARFLHGGWARVKV
ncbi:MAG: MATE family efflux transporter [Phycisphaerales bacterium]